MRVPGRPLRPGDPVAPGNPWNPVDPVLPGRPYKKTKSHDDFISYYPNFYFFTLSLKLEFLKCVLICFSFADENKK